MFAILIWQSIEQWSVLDAVMTRLKSYGPATAGMVAVLDSRILPLILGIVALFLIWEGREEIKDSRTNPGEARADGSGPRIEDSFNPINKLEANPKIETHVHFPPLDKPLSYAPAPTPISKVEPPKHRVCYMGPPQIVNLKSTGYDFDIRYVQEVVSETGVQGIIVIFRNDSDIQKVRTIHGATAQLKFFDKNNKEIGSGVSGAYWLKDYNSPEFDLIPGGNAGRLLVLIRNGSKFAIPYEQGRIMHAEEFKSCPAYIEVNVLDLERKKVCPVTISVKLEGRILKAETEHVS